MLPEHLGDLHQCPSAAHPHAVQSLGWGRKKGFLHFCVVRFGDQHGQNPWWGLSVQRAMKSAYYFITSDDIFMTKYAGGGREGVVVKT